MIPFSRDQLSCLEAAYPDRAVSFAHTLEASDMFSRERLAGLGGRLPADQVEYNLGDIDISQPDPAATPRGAYGVAETLARIDSAGSWVALRNVESDPEYRALMMECLAPVSALVAGATGVPGRPEAFIFVSSPGAITPFHFDPEHNILMQLEGEKILTLFPADDPEIVSPSQHETYHAGGHCNLAYEPALMAGKGTAWRLGPGDALYVPVKAPHWVQNGSSVSVSFSITWRSEASERHRRVYRLNRRLRSSGLNPGLMRAGSLRDDLKDLSSRIIDRLGLL